MRERRRGQGRCDQHDCKFGFRVHQWLRQFMKIFGGGAQGYTVAIFLPWSMSQHLGPRGPGWFRSCLHVLPDHRRGANPPDPCAAPMRKGLRRLGSTQPVACSGSPNRAKMGTGLRFFRCPERRQATHSCRTVDSKPDVRRSLHRWPKLMMRARKPLQLSPSRPGDSIFRAR